MAGRTLDRARILDLGARAGGLLAAVGLIATLLTDGPYLSGERLNPWLICWGVGLFTLLLFAPFALHRRIAADTRDRDRRWELAVVAWGGMALVGVLVFGALALASGFGTADPLGAVAIVGLIECGLVVGSVGVLILGTG